MRLWTGRKKQRAFRRKRAAKHDGYIRSLHRQMICASCFTPKEGKPKKGNGKLRTRAKYRVKKEDFEDV